MTSLYPTPFLKWAGNKTGILDRIRPALPGAGLPGAPQGRLVEPFTGSGAVFLGTDFQHYALNDFNRDVSDLYRALKTDPDRVVREARALFTPAFNTETAFYRLRVEFNALTGTTEDELARRGSLFIYLNRHCFNGLCRYNKGGGFNVPFGRYTKPYFPETELRAFSVKLNDPSLTVDITTGDFEPLMETAGPGDTVYCDPPYLPLSATSSFSSYATGGFGDADQVRLADAARRAAARGATVVVSNHDTPRARELYHDAQITAFGVQRFIGGGAKGGKRPVAAELLATWTPASPTG